MRMELMCVLLGAALTGAVLTNLELIQQPKIAKLDPYIRRFSPHLRPALYRTTSVPFTPGQMPLSQPGRKSVSANTNVSFQNGRFYTNGSAPPPVAPTVSAGTTQTATIPPPMLVANALPSSREFALRLDEPQSFYLAGQRIPIQLHDYGSETIGVRINYATPVRLRKQSNPDPHEMSELTLIYQQGSAKVYHLNTARAPIGCFMLRVIGDGA